MALMRRVLQETFVPGRTAALFKDLVDLVRREPLTPRSSFADRWQAAEKLSPEQQAVFAIKEIQAMTKRVKEGGIPHRQDSIPFTYGFSLWGRDKHATRIDIGDIPEGSLPLEIRNSLLTHLNNRATEEPKSWGGEPSLGLSLYAKPGLGGGSPGIELTVATVESADGSVWAGHRQGIIVTANPYVVMYNEPPFETRAIEDDYHPSTNQAGALAGLEEYVKATPPFQMIRMLAQFAEGVIQGKLPQPAQPQSTR